MKLTPIEDRIIVQPIDAADMTSGGVILPDMDQQGSIIAKVIAVGPGRYSLSGDRIIPMVTKIDDTVALPKFGAQKIDVEGEDYLIVKESEVLTIMEDTNGN